MLLVVLVDTARRNILNYFIFLLKRNDEKHGLGQFEERSEFRTSTVGFVNFTLYLKGLQGIQVIQTLYLPSSLFEEALSKKIARHDRFLRCLMKSNSVMGSIQSTELETISGGSVPTEHECDEDSCSERVSDRSCYLA